MAENAASGAGARSTGLLVWGGAAAVAAAVAFYFALVYAPLEATEGIVQKILYVHVPSAWSMYIGFTTNLVASIIFLINGKRGADRVALAGGEVGLVFCTLVLMSGPIWARPIWNVWWRWDPRLTMTSIVWFLYVGYLVTRAMAPSPEQGARYGAVVAIVAFLLLPVVHQAVEWWGGLHPQTKIGRKDALVPAMRTALIMSGLCFAVICSFFIALRTRVERLRDDRAAARAAVEEPA